MTYALVPAGLFALALMGARAVSRPALRLIEALRNRAAVLRLADLDDRTLKDIGLVRGDVAGALDEPFHVDPSAILSLRRGERWGAGDARSARARDGSIPRPALR